MDDPKVYDVVRAIFDCVRFGLGETSNQAPARAYVSMGVPAWDDCCDGQLVVWWSRVYGSSTFPDADTRPIVCQSPWTVVEVNVEIVRCIPGSDRNGNPPSVESLEEAARVANVDARAVWTAVQCCLVNHREVWEARVTGQVVAGPDGGCVGSRLTILVGVIDGCACS